MGLHHHLGRLLHYAQLVLPLPRLQVSRPVSIPSALIGISIPNGHPVNPIRLYFIAVFCFPAISELYA
jgi:hypothetical protein